MGQLKRLMNLRISEVCRLLFRPYQALVKLSVPSARNTWEMMSALFPGIDEALYTKSIGELLNNKKFFEELRTVAEVKKPEGIDGFGEWRKLLYLIIRIFKPEVVIETGVFDGLSSAAILQALEDNGKGSLTSIDLASDDPRRIYANPLPPDCQPGWVIPAYLRKRHRLILGDSKKILPQLIKKYKSMDIFFHDSLHTFEHMYFEYSIVWPHIVNGGLLLSHDTLDNLAFLKFCREQNRKYFRFGSFGAIRK